jgi:hypothetical protein
MLKHGLACAVVSSLVVISVSSFASPSYKDEVMVAPAPMIQAPTFQPYVGVNYVYYHSNYKSSVTDTVGTVTFTMNPSSAEPNNWSGASVDAGFKYGQYIGMEFGYYQTSSKSKTSQLGATTATINLLHKGFYTDFIGYYPIQEWDIIGSVGSSVNSLGNSNVQIGATKVTIRSDDGVTPRLGLGVDYHFNKNLGARIMGRYNFTQSNYVNHSLMLDAGLFYSLA